MSGTGEPLADAIASLGVANGYQVASVSVGTVVRSPLACGTPMREQDEWVCRSCDRRWPVGEDHP